MSTQLIRNIVLNQLDPIISRSRDSAREEGRKKIQELRSKIPTPEDLTKKLSPEINDGTCSEKGQEIFNKKLDISRKKILRVKKQVDRSINKLTKNQEKLNELINNNGPVETINNIEEVLSPIVKILQIVISVAPLGLSALGGIGTGFAITKLFDQSKIAKAKIGEYTNLFRILPSMISNYQNQARSIVNIINVALQNLNQLKSLLDKLEAFHAYLALQYEQGCFNLINGNDSVLGANNNILSGEEEDLINLINLGYSDLLDILKEQNPDLDYSNGKIIKRIYQIGEEFNLGPQISYEVISPLLLDSDTTDSEN